MAGLGFFTDKNSVAVRAGCRVIHAPENGRVVFPLGNQYLPIGSELPVENYNLTLSVRPLEFDIKSGTIIERAYHPISYGTLEQVAAKAIDEVVFRRMQVRSAHFVRRDAEEFGQRNAHDMIAAVEESNAEFEGFVQFGIDGIRYGYPVHHSHALPEGEVLGGMWSDLIILLRPEIIVIYTEEGVRGRVMADCAPRHPEAFVRCALEEVL